MRASRRVCLAALVLASGFAGFFFVGAPGSAAPGTAVSRGWSIRLLPKGFEAVGMNEKGHVVAVGSVEENHFPHSRIGLWRAGRWRLFGRPGWDCEAYTGEAGLDGPIVAGDVINNADQIIAQCSLSPPKGKGDGKLEYLLWNGGSSAIRFPEGFDPAAINERGQVVGDRQGIPHHAAVWEKGRIREIGALAGNRAADTEAVAINDRGQVIGSSLTAGTKHDPWPNAFLWENGRMRDLGTLGADSEPVAINSRGQVVGTSENTWDGDYWPGRVFLWENGKMREIGKWLPVAINDRGEIVGAKNGHAVLWRNGKLINLGSLPGFPKSIAIDINNGGEILCDVFQSGESKPNPKVARAAAFVWHNGKRTRLPLPPHAPRSFMALGINERGQVIGNNIDGGRGMIWSR